MNDFYIYILFRANGQPFYIGKGRAKRWFNHERPSDLARINSHRANVARQTVGLVGEIPKVKIADGLSNAVAYELEKLFIAAIGVAPNGPLLNKTPGGAGGDWGLSGKPQRPEHIQKRADALRGRRPSDKCIARVIEGGKLRRVLFDHEETEIAELYKTGLGSEEIGRQYGVSSTTILAIVRRKNGKVRKRHQKLSDKERDQVCELYRQGRHSTTLAIQFGVARQSILLLLHKRKVPVRPRGGRNDRDTS